MLGNMRHCDICCAAYMHAMYARCSLASSVSWWDHLRHRDQIARVNSLHTLVLNAALVGDAPKLVYLDVQWNAQLSGPPPFSAGYASRLEELLAVWCNFSGTYAPPCL